MSERDSSKVTHVEMCMCRCHARNGGHHCQMGGDCPRPAPRTSEAWDSDGGRPINPDPTAQWRDSNEALVPPMNRCAYVIHDSRGGDRRCRRLSCHTGSCDYEPEQRPQEAPTARDLAREIWDRLDPNDVSLAALEEALRDVGVSRPDKAPSIVVDGVHYTCAGEIRLLIDRAEKAEAALRDLDYPRIALEKLREMRANGFGKMRPAEVAEAIVALFDEVDAVPRIDSPPPPKGVAVTEKPDKR